MTTTYVFLKYQKPKITVDEEGLCIQWNDGRDFVNICCTEEQFNEISSALIVYLMDKDFQKNGINSLGELNK